MTLSYIPSDTNAEGILKATASGVLASGDTVIVNANGTVSVVAVTGAEITSSSVWLNSNIGPNNIEGAAVDTNSGKFILAFSDTANNYGRVVVATISGTTLSFGTIVFFNSGISTVVSSVYDSSTDRVVIVYKDNSNSSYGTAIVCSISGTTLSFGNKTVFASEGLNANLSGRYDATNSKVAIMWNGTGQNIGRIIIGTVTAANKSISFGSATNLTGNTYWEIGRFDYITGSGKFLTSYNKTSGILSFQVGTVSGSNVSFGSEFSFAFARGGANNGSGEGSGAPRTIFPTYVGSNKFFVPYVKSGTGTDGSTQRYRGAAVVVTVNPSNNTMSFGSEVIFDSGILGSIQDCRYDPVSDKVVIIYNTSAQFNTAPYTSYYKIATVSGSTASFATSVQYNSGGEPQADVITFDSTNNQMIINFGIAGGKGAYRVLKTQGTTLTAENYIGMSSGGTYASGSTATIKIIGNTSEDQSSLTAGQSYFVQTDGTIGLTPDDPSVFAGTAISSTKLIVKT